jgi:hypothetical protein
MAVTEDAVTSRLDPILEQVARAIGRRGIKEGAVEGAAAALRVQLEEDVKRVVQVYWTPFEADVPGQSVGLHVEVAEPKVHWAECYLSPSSQNWVFCFHERPDGEIQLAYHRDYETTQEALDGFFNLSGWYVLTATDKTWADVVYEVRPPLRWTEHTRTLAGSSVSAAVQESLKKSTIVWLRWQADDGEHTMPVWYLYDQKAGKIYVISGERQQTLPGAERIRECDLIFRQKMKNVRVAEVPASVRVLAHGEEWDQAAEKIAEKRLNIPGLPEETARRWRDECVILELTLRT